MNVLLIHNYYRHFGGEDMAVDNDLRLLSERGINVRAFTRHSDETAAYGVLDKLRFPLRTVHSRDTVRDLETVLESFSADVAYLHNLYPLISPSVYSALHRMGVPIVQVLHDYRPFCSNGWHHTEGRMCHRCTGGHHWNAVAHKCMHGSRVISAVYAATLWNLRRTDALRHVSAFICPSEYARLQAVRNGVEEARLFVRPHFIDVHRVRTGEGNGGYFLFLGRLSAEKGVWCLLQVAEQMKETRFILAGAGPLELEIRTWLSDRNMTNVELPGFCAGEAKWELIRNARAVVMPSESAETFGITVCEAYAAGRPVIASNTGSLPYLVQNGSTGLVYPGGDSRNLGRCVSELRDNPELAHSMGCAGRRMAEREFTPEASYNNLMKIFERVTVAGSKANESPLSAEVAS